MVEEKRIAIERIIKNIIIIKHTPNHGDHSSYVTPIILNGLIINYVRSYSHYTMSSYPSHNYKTLEITFTNQH